MFDKKYLEQIKRILNMLDLKYLYIAVLHFAITFFTDKLIFEYDYTNLYSLLKIKFCFFVILVILWQMFAYIIKNYKKNIDIQKTIKFSLIYFCIMMLFGLLVWPVIVGDQMYYIYMKDVITLTNTAAFSGYFIFYFRIVSLMLIPHLSGLIITQIAIISIIIGYIIQKFSKYCNNSKIIWLLYIPFLFPIVIEYNLHMEKDILFSYCIVLLICKLLFIKFDNHITKINLFVIALITSFISALRPDGIIFLFCPILFFMVNYKFSTLKNIIIFSVFLLITSSIFFPNYVDTVIIDKKGQSYKNSYMLNDTFKSLLAKAVSDDNKSILNEFKYDTDLTVEMLLSKDTGLHDGFFSGLNKRDKDKFQTIGNKLISEYKYQYVCCKFMQLKQIRFIWLDRPDIARLMTPYCYDCFLFVKDKINIISPTIYDKTIKFFEYKYHYYKKLHVLFVPICLLFVTLIISTFLREINFLFLSAFIIFFTVILVVIAPYPLFRYYFYIYLLGYFLTMILIISIFYKIKYRTIQPE